MRTISLVRHELDDDQGRQLDRALEHFHDVQDVIRITSGGTCSLRKRGAAVDALAFLDLTVESPLLVVTGNPLSDNWYTHAANGRGLITLADWSHAFFEDRNEEAVAAPDASILASLALTSVQIVCKTEDSSILHEQTVGCLFDFCVHKPDRALKMRAGYICDKCLSVLARRGPSSIEIDAIHAVLERVRHLVLGREPQRTTPQNEDAEDEEFLATSDLPEGVSIPPRLIEAVKERNLCLFVGSGMSLQDDVEVKFDESLGWTSLPSWSDVRRRMSESMKRYKGRSVEPREVDGLDEFLADMDFFRGALGEDLYYPRAIFDIFYPKVIRPGRANRLLYRLPTQWVLTTNYDALLQYAAPPGTPVFTWRESRQARELLVAGGDCQPILKLHGCASRPNTIVLTSLEYERLHQNEEYLSLLRYVFDSQVVLFLGFGFSDPFDLDMAIRQARLAGAAEGEKFALLPASRCAYAREKFHQVQTVVYQDHKSVAAIVAELVRASW